MAGLTSTSPAALGPKRLALPSGARRLCVSVRAAPELNNLLKKPELKKPEQKAPEPPKKLFSEEPSPSSQPSPATAAAPATPAPVEAATSTKNVVTIEYQRRRAKEMTKYFKELKLQEQIAKDKVFGWTPKNEINNGRWVMFGLAVGMLTEYATGVDFINQIKLMITYLGVADLE